MKKINWNKELKPSFIKKALIASTVAALSFMLFYEKIPMAINHIRYYINNPRGAVSRRIEALELQYDKYVVYPKVNREQELWEEAKANEPNLRHVILPRISPGNKLQTDVFGFTPKEKDAVLYNRMFSLAEFTGYRVNEKANEIRTDGRLLGYPEKIIATITPDLKIVGEGIAEGFYFTEYGEIHFKGDFAGAYVVDFSAEIYSEGRYLLDIKGRMPQPDNYGTQNPILGYKCILPWESEKPESLERLVRTNVKLRQKELEDKLEIKKE